MSDAKKYAVYGALIFAALYTVGILSMVLPGVARTNARNGAIEANGTIVTLLGTCMPACDDDDDDFTYDPFITHKVQALAAPFLGANGGGGVDCGGSQFNATVRYTIWDNATFTSNVTALWLSNPCASVAVGRAVSLIVDAHDPHTIVALEQTAGEWPQRDTATELWGWIVVIFTSLLLVRLACGGLLAWCGDS